jgi:hypothetical protein
MRDITIAAGDDVAFAYSLNHASGTLKNGAERVLASLDGVLPEDRR